MRFYSFRFGCLLAFACFVSVTLIKSIPSDGGSAVLPDLQTLYERLLVAEELGGQISRDFRSILEQLRNIYKTANIIYPTSNTTTTTISTVCPTVGQAGSGPGLGTHQRKSASTTSSSSSSSSSYSSSTSRGTATNCSLNIPGRGNRRTRIIHSHTSNTQRGLQITLGWPKHPQSPFQPSSHSKQQRIPAQIKLRHLLKSDCTDDGGGSRRWDLTTDFQTMDIC
ncbi:cell wall integrity and stress response component 1-like isoform X2 [Siniperca chuatsi]|uniref:cell wall integrity and stress response component 1-like isoform X2 n=1 Tax=Siniperca chuatsi TaxID=119488 RepID=UPI001CE2171F|nr:cell wall integrity and stress response component 1-like isoform X2 [Siniperca chuatsi]XP_044060931.1 cell wall integrity and stress response component 1-like isoform X2 [Siniperca chuatsi]XP_044060932.1 cell wall integrity and stress response component 1-like isoform X2 [Siniperca chuatsi]XP_044060933.1 cell wall integrity and stress response component 1-like isoform X2 [Siniperca chuatsi]XP_044060934.1 cell wall integrity and stress response component 1-like isoform X2 [Siniperca chuatsi]